MKLLFRVDASTQIGTGHVMRCLALAQAWQDMGRQAIFVMATQVPALESRLRSENISIEHSFAIPGSVEDAKETIRLAHQVESNWVVLDGYHFDSEYQRILKKSGLKLLFIDDCGYAKHYYADIVLNQNICADETLYIHREPYTQLLLGTHYALLRREFWQWRGWQRETHPVARKILVTLGGSDPENVTLKVIQALQQVRIEGLEAIVVVGGSNPHYEQLETAVQTSPFPISLKRNAIDMPELMAWADVAIAAGGSTNWELAFMGLPSIVIVLADNQREIVDRLDKIGIVINLGWHKDVKVLEIAEAISSVAIETELQARMTELSKKLVDGEGSKRVLSNLE
jgi:UDP-2,4-diacetamido-2,4,6-trideoxy-beta-L-altropyranose hydrolase